MNYTRFNDWVREHYTPKEVEEVNRNLKAAGEKWLSQFPDQRKGIDLAAAKKHYDQVALDDGGSQARDAFCKIVLADTVEKHLDYGVVGDVLQRSRQHAGSMYEQIRAVVEHHMNSHNLGLLRAVQHAQRFSGELLLPLYKVQHPAWMDRLNNSTGCFLTGLDYSVMAALEAESRRVDRRKSRSHKTIRLDPHHDA